MRLISMEVQGVGGFSLIEVMITLFILAVGMLGLAGLEARSIVVQREAYQRSVALSLVRDMTDRIESDGANAGSYAGLARGTGAVEDPDNCTSIVSVFARNACSWHNALLDADSTLRAPQGCVEQLSFDNYCVVADGQMNGKRLTMGSYLVSVAWGGATPTFAPVSACGLGDYGDDRTRRLITLPVVIRREVKDELNCSPS